MAKEKTKSRKGSGGMVQSHLRARISYLNQASTFLQAAVSKRSEMATKSPVEAHCALPPSHVDRTGASNIARQYGSQARAVSLKSRLRIPRGTKRSICKRCDAFLVPGVSCREEIENKSRGSKKSWADVRVVKCGTCGTVKRFPQGKERSMKLEDRKKELEGGAIGQVQESEQDIR